MNSLLSVIVPAYNREKELGRCLDSILVQTYSNLEIIIVDDGSTDGTAKTCDDYAKRDERIRVIHRENGGAVAARRTGVENAKGEVVTFVDSDDFIEPDMYESMMAVYDEYAPDVITSGYYVNEGRDEVFHDTISEGYYDKAQIKTQIVPRMMFDFKAGTQGILPSLCIKIFRKYKLENVLKKTNLQVTLGEDAVVTYPLLVQADSIYIMHNKWYHYVLNDSSMCHECSLDIFEKVSVVQKEFVRMFEELGIMPDMKNQVNRYIGFLLDIAIKGVYGISMKNVTYVFPFDKVPKGSRIVLYGAGVIGDSYWQCLRNEQYAKTVAWVDRGYTKIGYRNGVKIENPIILGQMDFDYVVIAVKNPKQAKEIEWWLLEQGISPQKIIWTSCD